MKKTQSKKEEVDQLLRKQVSEASEETKEKCSEINKLAGEFAHSVGMGWSELRKIKEGAYTGGMINFEKTEKELFNKLEKGRSEVRAELDELHRMLGKHEEKVRYKDEAEGELQALEEVKVMLGDKLRNIARRVERLKVRSHSNFAKLFAEAKEAEEEVKRTDEDILDFEREYTKFLSMVGKLSG
jgi:chromosome segregation ATPase